MQPTLKPSEYKLDGVFNIERYADKEYESSPEHKYICAGNVWLNRGNISH